MRGLNFEANQQPELSRVFSTYSANSQVYLDINRNKAQILGIAVSDIFQALQATMGGYYINQFNAYGRGLAGQRPGRRKRSKPPQRHRVNVANAKGDMIPLRLLMMAEAVVGPQPITRYDKLRAVNITSLAQMSHLERADTLRSTGTTNETDAPECG